LKLSQRAYERFKDALFNRRIPLGQTLTQAELIRLLDVPIGPLREAMQRLEQEGLLTPLPREGVRINKPDPDLIKNAFQLRRILEAEALRKFAEQATAETLGAWRARHQDLLARAEAGEIEATLTHASRAVDDSFHAAILAAVRNPLIEEAHARNNDRIRVIRLDLFYMPVAIAIMRTMEEHLKVIDALLARDAEAAVAAMDEHLTRAMHRAMGF
jgi:DNA-binding GntR family transcriptional regulator